MAALTEGSVAPDFELKTASGETVRLSDLTGQGKHVVIAFFPAAFSSVCSDEMSMFQEFIEEFDRRNAVVVGISVDNTHSLAAWADKLNLTMSLASDFHPKGAVAESYGAMGERGTAGRVLFVVDPQGVIRYSYTSPGGQNPGVDGVLDALDELQGAQ